MNTKYFFQISISCSIFLAACAALKHTRNSYPRQIVNSSELAKYDTTNSLPSFLVISDIHLNSSAAQNAAHGDTGDSLWMAAKMEIQKLIAERKPRFIIILGDLPRHDTTTKRDSILVRQNIRQVITWFKDSAKIPGEIPLIYVPGNNDSWNGDYSALTLPDSVYKFDGYPFVNVDSAMAKDHAYVANDSLLRSIGCFSVYPLGNNNKLKVIALNTVIFNKAAGFPYSQDTTEQSTDAAKEINWLWRQLQQSAQNNEKVLLAMHIPPGIDGYSLKNMWYDKNTENSFLSAIEKYQNNIVGLLAGHTHMDGVRLLTSGDGDIDALLISVAGVAPGHGNNPSMKLIEYNPDNFALENFSVYYMKYWNRFNNENKYEQRLTGWNDSFSFRNTADYNHISDTLSLLQYFQEMKSLHKDADINHLVNEIYSDYGKKPDSSEVGTSIYVNYRK